MGARIGQEIPLTLEAQTKRRRYGRLARHRHMVQCVEETQRKSDYQQRAAKLHLVQPTEQMVRCKRPEHCSCGQGGTFNFDHGNVNLASVVLALAPQTLAVTVQGDRELQRLGHVR